MMDFIAATPWILALFGWSALVCLFIIIAYAINHWRRQARENRQRWNDPK
jgi:hypothetical protein